MMTTALSTDEKAAAFDVFKDPDNREIFLSSKEDDPQAALVWLRKAVAKLQLFEGMHVFYLGNACISSVALPSAASLEYLVLVLCFHKHVQLQGQFMILVLT